MIVVTVVMVVAVVVGVERELRSLTLEDLQCWTGSETVTAVSPA